MIDLDPFVNASNKTTEARHRLELEYNDQQFLCQSIIETAGMLDITAIPDTQKSHLKNISLIEDVIQSNGSLYPAHTNLAMKSIFTPQGEPLAELTLSGRNAYTLQIVLNPEGSWTVISDDEHKRINNPRTWSHITLVSFLESKLQIPEHEKHHGHQSERYKMLELAMDTAPISNNDKVMQLGDVLTRFSHDPIVETYYSNAGVNDISLVIRKTKKQKDYALSVVSPPYTVGTGSVQKAYRYTFSHSNKSLLPTNGGGIVFMSGKEVEITQIQLSNFARIDQNRNYPMEVLTQGLSDILNPSGNRADQAA